MALQLDKEEGSLAAMASRDGENDKKRAKMKNFIHNHKSSNIASPGSDIERNEQYAEGACVMPLTNDLQNAASASHPQPTSWATLTNLEPRLWEKTEEKDIMQENSNQAPPKTLKLHPSPEQNQTKHENSPLWYTNRISPNCPQSKAACPDKKPAVEPQNLTETHGDSPEVDDVMDTTDLINDYEDTCVICYDIMVRPHEVRPCGHVFCELCLRQLQSTTASQLPLWNPQGGRNGRQRREILVLCPICRGPIEKCQVKEGLNEIVRGKYPHRHLERLKLLHDEIRKLKNCRLPRSRAAHYQRLRPNLRINLIQNQLLPAVNKVKEFFQISGTVLLTLGGIGVSSMYLISMMTTIGLVKFCFACVGKRGLLFDRERGNARTRITFYVMQGLSGVLFLAAVKQVSTCHWGQLIGRSLLVLFPMSMGYYLDSPAGPTTSTVLLGALSYPGRR